MFNPSCDYGKDHDSYFKEYREQLAEYVRPKASDSKDPVIIIPGREARGSDPIARQIHEFASLLHDNGWDYKVGYAQVRVPAASSRSREKTMDRSWINAVKRGHEYLTISYRGESGTGKFTIDSARIGFKIVSVTEMKDEIKR